MLKKTPCAKPSHLPIRKKVNLVALDLSPLAVAVATLLDALEQYNAVAIDNDFRLTMGVLLRRSNAGIKIAEAEEERAKCAPDLKEGHLLPVMENAPHPIAIPFMELYDLLREARQGRGQLGQILLWKNENTPLPDARPVISMLRRIVDGFSKTPKTGGTGTQMATLAIITRMAKGKGIRGKSIVAQLKKQSIEITDSTFRRNIVPWLKEHGVENERARGGYYLPE